jgi:hypothetical protein
MRLLLFAFSFVGLLSACTQQPPSSSSTAATSTQNPAAKNAISCANVDKIQAQHTEADLINLYGKENVVRDSLYAEGMAIAVATFIYKDKPEELEVQWREGAEFKQIAAVRINQPNAPYTTENGIRIGTPIKDVEKLNGAPLGFSGFGWDYGGGCCNYNNGKIPQSLPCFSMQLAITDPEPEKKVSEEALMSVMGDQEVKSDNPVFDKVQASVVGLQISFMGK